MTPTKALIERLYALDARRTPTYANPSQDRENGQLHIYHADHPGRVVVTIKSYNGFSDNRDFYAAAPQMMTVIREQEAEIAAKDAEIERLESAIEELQIMADEARKHITARPANKPRANSTLLRMAQRNYLNKDLKKLTLDAMALMYPMPLPTATEKGKSDE